MNGSSQRGLWVLRILSAIALLAVGVIHIYLVFNGVGGFLGVMFVLQGIAGIVLAIAIVALRGGLLKLTIVLSLLFMIAGLVALLLALTIGLFGITETWDFMLVRETVIIESIGIVLLAVATFLVLRRPSAVTQR